MAVMEGLGKHGGRNGRSSLEAWLLWVGWASAPRRSEEGWLWDDHPSLNCAPQKMVCVASG